MIQGAFEDIEPEFQGVGVLACSTFRTARNEVYSVVTIRFSAPPPGLTWPGYHASNIIPVDRQGHRQDYGSLLFINEEPAEWPLGDLPGNMVQGIFQAHTTREQALAAHDPFVERVKAFVRGGKP